MTLEDIDELTPPERQLFAKVGKAKFGDDWVGIERLTSRERWLYDRYVKGTRRGGGSSILPGHITFVPADGGRTWAERPHGPKLLAEVEDASDRIDWLITKYTWVDEWLDDNDFGDVVDLDALQQALINSGLIAEDALPMPAAPKEPDTLPEPDQSVGTEPTPLSSTKQGRKDAKRPEVIRAICDLWVKENRLTLPDKKLPELRAQVDEYLGWKIGTCKERTWARAIAEIKCGPTSG